MITWKAPLFCLFVCFLTWLLEKDFQKKKKKAKKKPTQYLEAKIHYSKLETIYTHIPSSTTLQPTSGCTQDWWFT